MQSSPALEVAGVLRDVRARIARPGASSAFSGWRTQAEALAEIDWLLRVLGSGERPPYPALRILFLATGPIQDLSVDNGWGTEFLELAERFDEELDRLYPEPDRR
jgi:hypothetical protein